MNVIVVEDNKVTRKEVCDILNEIDFDISVVGDFSNGEDALSFLKNNRIDIIFSDIQMPRMSGLDLLEIVKKEMRETEVVILSAYDDFSYFKSALRNNAFDYILKPVSEENCIEVINRIFEKHDINALKNEEKRKFVLQKHIISEILTLDDNDCVFKEAVQLFESTTKWLAISVKKSLKSNLEIINEDKEMIKKALADLINDMYGEDARSCFFDVSLTDFALILYGDIYIDDVYDSVVAFSSKLKSKVCFGIGNIKTDIQDLKQTYIESKKALSYTVYSENNYIIQYETIAEINNSDIAVSYMLSELKKIIKTKNKDNIEPFLAQWLHSKEYMNIIYISNFVLCLIFALETILNEKGNSFESVTGNSIWEKIDNLEAVVNVHNWIYNIISAAFDIVNNKQINDKKKIADNVKMIIEENYCKKISASAIAQMLHYSLKYLSEIFNEVEGCSIFAYITWYKMEKAKELLDTTDMKVYEVMNTVGYTKNSHFCKLFKEHTGYMPNKYKKRNESPSL